METANICQMYLSRTLQQFQRESESWKRLLEFLQEENIHLKTRIAEIVNQDISEELLALAENFQDRSILKDEMLALTRQDVLKFDNLLTREYIEDGNIIKEVAQKQKKLHREIETLEQQFNKLKSEFYTCLTENF